MDRLIELKGELEIQGSNSNGANSKGRKPADSFTFIQGLIKEVYRGNTFPFCGSVGKEITNQPSVFP